MQIRNLAAAFVIGSAASAVAVTAVGAQSMACGSRDEMTQRLKQTFGEAQTGLGLVSTARVLEVWSSEETGTWTILMTEPNGQSCMVAAGEAWKRVPVQALVRGEPT